MTPGTLSEREHDAGSRRGFRWILLGSFCLHLLLLAGLFGVFYRSPEVVITPAAPESPQFVDLLDASELPEELPLPDFPEEVEKPLQETRLAFRSMSSLAVVPSPTPPPTVTPTPLPTALPTATATPLPTPTPVPTSGPTPSPTPRRPRTPVPKFNWTPKPKPTLRGTVKPAIRLEPYQVPKREGVLDATPVMVRRTPKDWSGSQGGQGAQHFLGSRSSLVLDQENAFPFPGYLLHLEEKIAGLWFPQGAGSVTIFLEIGRNGKILKSEVDKGAGVGVEKLQESVVRALSLIRNFEALPWEYQGTTLRVRIIVRR